MHTHHTHTPHTHTHTHSHRTQLEEEITMVVNFDLYTKGEMHVREGFDEKLDNRPFTNQVPL